MSEYPESEVGGTNAPTPPARDLTPPPRRRGGGLFWGFLGGCLVSFGMFTLILVALGLAFESGSSSTTTLFATNAVAVVEVNGEITGSRDVVDKLRQYAADSGVRAIVVRIDSPGGGIVPSQEIYREIRRVREENGKPVVASLGDLAASGGYYIASACDEIVTNPGTVTGSIGVIAQWMNVGKLLDWAHVKPETITSGSMKDAGSPYRPMTDEERAYYQNLLDELHAQFVHAVAEGRKGRISEGEVKALADGRVFSGQDAVRLKLADRIGSFYDAVARAATLAGIKGSPELIYPRPDEPGLLDILMSTKSMIGQARGMIEAQRSHPFMYRWN